MTVRNNKNKIIQFSYGDDNIDTIKSRKPTNTIVKMSKEEIYDYFIFQVLIKMILMSFYTG